MLARLIISIATTVLIGCSAGYADAELFVVCHSATHLDAEDIVDVFAGGKQYSGDIKLAPVDNVAAQEEFLAKVLHMNSAKYSTLWIKKSFRDGTRPPLVKANDTETMQFIRKTPGAVGYVKSQPSGVTVIKKY